MVISSLRVKGLFANRKSGFPFRFDGTVQFSVITSLGKGGLVCKGRNSTLGKYQYTAKQMSQSLRATAV